METVANYYQLKADRSESQRTTHRPIVHTAPGRDVSVQTTDRIVRFRKSERISVENIIPL